MIIRPAGNHDIPAIISLLKLSLGESLMPKSEALWRWKHVDNPFGPSPVLLAFDGNTLAGVRAFMRWEWKQKNEVLRAVRAVDTATHPGYQGRGIFSRLTCQLADLCREEGVHFIFNTPNAQSRPGYLKMGWYRLGRLSLQVLPVLTFGPAPLAMPQAPVWDELEYLLQQNKTTTLMGTNRTPGFMRWRYSENPVIRYSLAGSAQEGIAVYRLKDSRWGREMRITELILPNSGPGKGLWKMLHTTARFCGARFITLAVKSGFRLGLTLPAGPMVTARLLNMSAPITFRQWAPSLGDMELF